MKLYTCFRDLRFDNKVYPYFTGFIKNEIGSNEIDAFYASKFNEKWSGSIDEKHEEKVYLLKNNNLWIFEFKCNKIKSQSFSLNKIDHIKKEFEINKDLFISFSLKQIPKQENPFDKFNITIIFKIKDNENNPTIVDIEQNFNSKNHYFNNSLIKFYDILKEKSNYV